MTCKELLYNFFAYKSDNKLQRMWVQMKSMNSKMNSKMNSECMFNRDLLMELLQYGLKMMTSILKLHWTSSRKRLSLTTNFQQITLSSTMCQPSWLNTQVTGRPLTFSLGIPSQVGLGSSKNQMIRESSIKLQN